MCDVLVCIASPLHTAVAMFLFEVVGYSLNSDFGVQQVWVMVIR